MRAEELQRPITDLRVHDPVCVSPTTTVRQVIAKLQELRAGCVLVTGDDGELIGIFTERDVLRKLADDEDDDAVDGPISAVMTPRPEVLHEDDSIVFALHQMHIGGYRHIPLVDLHNRPVAVVSVRMVVDFLAGRLDAGA
ncbi:MAG: CBS domain-containing protein [Candidatus Poribacteria bacterium]|nr:CBS domain-containing protein [Candidatus Poribacteria bacterium]